MNVIDFYTKVLGAAGITDVSGEGFLSAEFAGKHHPLTIDGKRLMLPTTDVLRAGLNDQQVAFHPMSENISRGESPVLKIYKDCATLRFSVILQTIISDLLEIAVNVDSHKKLGKAAEFLRHVSNADEKSLKAWQSIGKALSKNPDRRLISLYLKRGGVNDEDYSRSCIVSFPICDDFEHDRPEILGVAVKPKDKETLKGLIEYVLGDAETRAQYSFGTKNLEAPYFHALMTSIYKLGTRLNQIVERHKKHLPSERLLTDLSWAEQIDSLALYRGVLPALSGNEGVLLNNDGSPDLQARAQEYFSRSSEAPAERDDAPFDGGQPVGTGSTASRPDPGQSRQESRTGQRPAPAQAGEINSMDDFHKQFERQREPSRAERFGASSRRDEGRGGSFRDKFRSTENNDRFETRRAGYDGGERQTLRGRGRSSGRGGFL